MVTEVGVLPPAGKRCDDPSCGGYLMDTIINFGESLPISMLVAVHVTLQHLSLLSASETLETSFDHAQKAELCLAMGSSLTVTPAAEVPQVHYWEFCLLLRLPMAECAGRERLCIQTQWAINSTAHDSTYCGKGGLEFGGCPSADGG